MSENGFNKSTSIAIAKEFLGKHPQSIFLTGASTHKFLFDEADTEDYSTKIQEGVWVNSYNSALQIIPNQKWRFIIKRNWFLELKFSLTLDI